MKKLLLLVVLLPLLFCSSVARAVLMEGLKEISGDKATMMMDVLEYLP